MINLQNKNKCIIYPQRRLQLSMKTRFTILLIFLLFCGFICQIKAQTHPELLKLKPQIQDVIKKAQYNIWAQIEPDHLYWNNRAWLGTLYLSQYWFQLKALNMTGELTQFRTRFNPQFFKTKLIKQQLADGSWKQVLDENLKSGFLDATIMNYWFLKDVGVPIQETFMQKAKEFILAHGGIQGAQVMTKYKLAAFGHYDWSKLIYIPLFVFEKEFLFSYGYIKDYVGQWVYPHLIPLAYLRYHKATFPISSICISELMLSPNKICENVIRRAKQQANTKKGFHQLDSSVQNLLNQTFKVKGPKSAFGAYTVSTVLTMLAFQHYGMTYGTNNPLYNSYKSFKFNSLEYIENLYFNPRVPYDGSYCDGRYWDTLLNVYGLLQSGQDPSNVNNIIQNLAENVVQPNGGIPYGIEFQYSPDIDDTSILLTIYGKMKKYYESSSNKKMIQYYEKQINRTSNWIKYNQNIDGGFAAFDRDKNDNQYKLIELVFSITGIDDSTEIFDPSCADITGHILQSFGECRIHQNQSNRNLVQKSIQFLKATKKEKMWSARWGINYIYAAGAVIPGLSRINYDLTQQWVVQVVKRLQEVQHQDGGFGQDSQSYNQDKFINGVSTVSMTSWGLFALLQMREIIDVEENILRATRYILKNFQQNHGKFYDRSVIGTGHRGYLNLQFASYAYTFPLIALSRVVKPMNLQKIAAIKQDVVHQQL